MLPTVLFIGIQHSGTTSLANSMGIHSELSFGSEKENKFWQMDGKASPAHLYFTGEEPTKAEIEAMSKKSPRTLDEYMQRFNATIESCELKHFFDADPATVYLAKGTWEEDIEKLQEVKDTLGEDIKLMMLIRDPYDVVISKTTRCQSDGTCNSEGCLDIDCMLARYSSGSYCPFDSIKSWQKMFPEKDNWLFLRTEDFFAEPQSTLDEITSFLNVSNKTYTEEELASGTSGRRRSPSPLKDNDDVRRQFHESPELQECRSSLENVTGLVFDTWAVD